MIGITDYRFDFVREPLKIAFSFKGGSFTEKWIVITSLKDRTGHWETGIGGLAVLWSDSTVAGEHSEAGGNILMAAVAERGAKLAVGREFDHPEEVTLGIADELKGYASAISGIPEIRDTFIFNSLVSLDCSLWKHYARYRRTCDARKLLSSLYGDFFTVKHNRIARVPTITYHMGLSDIEELAEMGHFLFKIKIGHSGSQEEMLKHDRRRLLEVHEVLKDYRTPNTEKGVILYYLDANGRYSTIDAFLKLVDFLDRSGIKDRVVIIEEPFPEECDYDVSGIPIRIAADESIQSVKDVAKRAKLGYNTIALKPAGKTPSLTARIAIAAIDLGATCFVADSACIPVLLEWNKLFAACLPSLPELSTGFLESNGPEHYLRWDELLREHPCTSASWIIPKHGMFELDEKFFTVSGGILKKYPRYEEILKDSFNKN
ncbi:MAG: hypothetical protein DRP87_09150 [Spirochaetes bacterium]|nr:MAG: hypothetical protein DRP87_09150 [Spirochaetota bacterium]